jgi:Putative transposase
VHYERRLEKLCRYAARPPVVNERLSLTADGKVLYKFKRAFRGLYFTLRLIDPLSMFRWCAPWRATSPP